MHKMDVPLPKARVSEVLGLLEILDDEGGHVDLYKLGRTLGHDIDELISTIETAQLFNLVEVDNGDVVFTEVGKQFTDQNMEQRKTYISEVLSKLPYMVELLTALAESEEHSVDMEYLERIMTVNTAKEKLSTSLEISWTGRDLLSLSGWILTNKPSTWKPRKTKKTILSKTTKQKSELDR